MALAAASQTFTVILTVKVRSTNIGVGFPAIRPEATFRDLSTSIDSRDHLGHRQRGIGVGQGNDQEGLASNALSYCPDSFFRTFFYRHNAARAVSLKVTIKIDRLAPLGERSGGARSTPSILAERFTSAQCRPAHCVLGRCCVRSRRSQTAPVSITSMKRSAPNPSGYRVQADLLASASRDWSAT